MSKFILKYTNPETSAVEYYSNNKYLTPCIDDAKFFADPTVSKSALTFFRKKYWHVRPEFFDKKNWTIEQVELFVTVKNSIKLGG